MIVNVFFPIRWIKHLLMTDRESMNVNFCRDQLLVRIWTVCKGWDRAKARRHFCISLSRSVSFFVISHHVFRLFVQVVDVSDVSDVCVQWLKSAAGFLPPAVCNQVCVCPPLSPQWGCARSRAAVQFALSFYFCSLCILFLFNTEKTLAEWM